MNFRKILNLEFNSVFLRNLLSLYYKPGRYYRIPLGHLRGFRIWYDRTINFHAVLGIWEKNNFDVLNKVFSFLSKKPDGLVVYDIGANIGLFTLFFSKYKPKVKIVAFEAVADTVELLKRNLLVNSVGDVEINNKAVASHDGEVSFFIGHHHKSSLVQDWASDGGTRNINEIKVPAISLDSFVGLNPELSPDFIKIDVEGGGDKVLEGATDIFRTKRPLVLIESHNPVEDNAIIEMLNELAYDAYRINNRKWVVNKARNYEDPDGVWGNLLLIPQERSSDFLNCLK